MYSPNTDGGSTRLSATHGTATGTSSGASMPRATAPHQSQSQDYVVQSSGRFSHSPRYVEALAARHHMVTVFRDAATLRRDDDGYDFGYIYVLEKRAGGERGGETEER